MIKSPKNEKRILNIIKFGPLVLVLLLSFMTTQMVLLETKEKFDKEVQSLEKSYMNNNKNRVKEEVEEVYNYILNEKENSEKLLKQNIKNKVEEAYQIANHIYKKGIQENSSKEDIFKNIKNALEGMIYNDGRGYIFIDDIKGRKLLLPFNKDLEGKSFINFEDAKGYKFVEKIVSTIKNKTEAYDSYYWFKPGNKEKAFKKISFYKYFEPYNIAIGTGEYVDEFEKKLKERILEKIRNIRYSKNGYIFLFDLEGNCLSHYNTKLIGKNRINDKDDEGRYYVKDIIEFPQNKNDGFMKYTASLNPNQSENSNSKISYIKLFEEWNWVIGTGFYTDTLNNQIANKKTSLIESNKTHVNKIIIISFTLTIIFIIISFYISNYIKKIFNTYTISLDEEMNKTIEKEKILEQQSKMAMMGEMIANIAHQWRQPLSIISMSNDLVHLNQKTKINTQEQIDSAIININNSVKHLATTIDDFKNFFCPYKEKKYFMISRSINKTLNLIDSQFNNKRISIYKEIDDIEVYLYENELLQVLINIFKNAIDELSKNNKVKEKAIYIKIKNENNKLFISIKDNAGGIPQDIIEQIFDPYFTTKRKEGTGIGLYMSKQIINNMQGQISVNNTEFYLNKTQYLGAEFTITIPIKLDDD